MAQCSALTKFLTDKIFDVQNIHLFLCIGVALDVWLVDTEVETNNVADDSVGSDLFLCDKIVTSPGDSKLALTVIRLIVAAVFVTICFRCITGVTMCGATQQAVPSAAVSLLSWRTLS